MRRHLWVEVFFPEVTPLTWRAFVSDHDETVEWEGKGNYASRFSPAYWISHHRLVGKSAVVVVVSNVVMSRQTAVEISECIVLGRTRSWEVKIPTTWWD